MPIYEYTCSHCGSNTEILQKISDAPATKCPSCGNDALTKQISATSFHLKGSGWYVTDFKDKKTSSGNEKKAESGSKPADNSSDK